MRDVFIVSLACDFFFCVRVCSIAYTLLNGIRLLNGINPTFLNELLFIKVEQCLFFNYPKSGVL